MYFLTILLASLHTATAAPTQRVVSAPVYKPRGATLIEGKYLIKMKDNVSAAAVTSAISAIAADADYTYSSAFNGFAASLSTEELEALRNDPNVLYIEQDAVVTITASQENAEWGLARISNAKPGSTTYTYDDSAGKGTCVYILDTGIDIKHPEFEGRAQWLANFADKNKNDVQGHGTHVAGTVGSRTYGVAKQTTLFAVKVLDDSGKGTNNGIVAGMDFVIQDAQKRQCPNGVVVNMSLGGSTSSTINGEAAKMVRAGHFVAVAAGNEGKDASSSSPASEPSVCTVGATDRDDKLATYSNTGKLVDVLAPGSGIMSTFPGGGTKSLDGTSMASPHVAGLGAYLLGLGKKSPGLCDYIASTAIKGVISIPRNSTSNLLINNGNK